MAKWVEEGGRPLEQVNPYQNEAENIIGCHGKPINPLTECADKLTLKRLICSLL